ncbi:EF-hand domain-containing protein [Asticcacaulis sp. AND118]|uniref:EF-hand domain-containing protein n=1 Tax=Asticcacaulis sp. AND118 TaxID=2840468 RepID=UPI001CFFF493|nr:EF-hand domain-containing protein [Asticcacaulis sp. AND118]UDF02803.1 EF-hand domain-containing protein [Asticcacaulis sp. AND118]
MIRHRILLPGLLLGGGILAVAGLPVLAQGSGAPEAPPPEALLIGPPPFEAIDANKDGQISPAELAAFRPPHCGPEGEPGKGPKGFAPGPEALDADKDGRLSWAEFSAPMKAHFDEIDANKNGYIDADEAPKGRVMPHPDRLKGTPGKPAAEKDVLIFRHGPCAPEKAPEKP